MTINAFKLKWQILSLIISLCSLTTTHGAAINQGDQSNIDAIVSRIKSRMDESTDPCNDFYQYACGGYTKPIPPDRDAIGVVEELSEVVKRQVNEILIEKVVDTDLEPFKLAKTLYRTCMDESEINKVSEHPLKSFLGEIIWPATDLTMPWIEIVKHGRDNGVLSGALLNVYVDVDLMDSTRYILYIDQADGSLPQEIFLDGIDEPVIQAYLKLIEWMMTRLSPETKNAKELAQEILEFEIKLAKIADTKEERRDLTKVHLITDLERIQKVYTYFNWTEYLTNILSPEQYRKLESKPIILGGHEYFYKLKDLLDQTPKRVLHNYAAWTLVAEASAMLSKDFREQLYEMEKVSYGIEREEDRWKECTSAALTLLPKVVGSMYVRKFFNTEAKLMVTKITLNFLKEFELILMEIDWMDEKTRETALKKIRGMDYFIGHAEELMNDSLLETYYDSISLKHLNPDVSFFELVLKITNFTINEMFGLLSEKASRKDWRFIQTPATSNAFYLSSHNHIELAAGILQGEFFDLKRPNFLNYATLGMVIGHEISHAFDDEGSQYDENGNVRNWWQEEAHKKFYEKAKCFVQQYGNFSEGGMKINGASTQGENVADHGGTSVSYRAYKKYAGNKEVVFDGLNFTQDQLFWVSAAQMWCTNRRKESIRMIMETGEHSLEKFRVQGAFSNSEDFVRDFNCPLGSPMNPENKCKMW